MSSARIIASALLVAFIVRPAPAVWHAIVDDDAGAPAYIETGSTWTTSTQTGYNSGAYRWAAAGASATATWTADLPAAGDYDVLVWYRESYNRATAAHYDVFAADGTHTVLVDQQVDGQIWKSLGVFPFEAGSQSIRLDAAASTGGTVVIADAVRFRDTSCDCLPDELDTIAMQAMDIFHAIDGARDENAYANNTDAGVLAWNDSTVMMAYLAMYEATRDPEYLDVVKRHAELIFPHRGDRIGMLDEPRDRMMPAWIATPRHELGYHAWVVHQGMITFPLARWIYLVNRDPSLRAEHGAQADAWLADIIEMTTAFEEEVHDGPNRGEQYYDFRYMRENPDDPMPFNQQNALGRTFVMLWLITGDEQYRARAEGLARFFKRRLTPIDDRYTWLYSVFSTWHEDVGHAGINVDFAFQCYRAGIVFDAVDMQRFANTVRYLSLGADGFLGTVNGIPASGPEEIPGILRWIHLGFADPGLRSIFDEYVQANWTTGSMFWLGSAYLAETSHPDRSELPLTAGSATPILLSESSLTAAGSVSEGVAEQSFTVMTGSMTRLDYAITTSATWLTVTPAAGSVTCGADSITVEFGAAAPLPSQCGPHTAVISISAPGTAIEPQTIDVTLTILPSSPDFDRDDDVDLTDFGTFQACFNGPNRPPFYPSCGAADLDCDGDVDLADFGMFAARFNGPNRPPAYP